MISPSPSGSSPASGSNPASGACSAEACTATPSFQQTVQVVEQEQMARDTFRLRLACPEIARHSLPGQFFMIRQAGGTDPLLGRPFALYDTWLDESGQPAGIDIGYLLVGKMTRLMQTWQPGDSVEIWGPLGNGFSLPNTPRLIMTAGGIGQTPFLAVAREALGLRQYGNPVRTPQSLPEEVVLCYGVRSADYLAGLKDFAGIGLDVRLATDDGTFGHHGYVTDLLAKELEGDKPAPLVYCCGPEPMMHAVSKLTARHGVDCRLSLETPMACGFGACFSCVTRVFLDDGTWDYRRVCVEGPVFPADRIVFD